MRPFEKRALCGSDLHVGLHVFGNVLEHPLKSKPVWLGVPQSATHWLAVLVTGRTWLANCPTTLPAWLYWHTTMYWKELPVVQMPQPSSAVFDQTTCGKWRMLHSGTPRRH